MVRNGFLLRFFSSWTHDQWLQRCSPALGVNPTLSARDANIPRYVFSSLAHAPNQVSNGYFVIHGVRSLAKLLP